MASQTWADVEKGDRVELKGKTFVVAKIKAKGKKAKVVVVGGGGRFESEVRLKDAVRIVTSEGWLKNPPARERRPALPAGDPSVTKPPAKKYGNPWETTEDRIERKLETILGARLVAETDDESAGYYVPPVDVSTIASHAVLFHGLDPTEYDVDGLLEAHTNHHAAALKGVPLYVNHWHTAERPKIERK